MQFRFYAWILGALSLTTSASAHGDRQPSVNVHHTSVQPTSAALKLGRKLAAAEAGLRGSNLAAETIINSLAGSGQRPASLVISQEQRDATVLVLQAHGYLEHLAQMYASVLSHNELRVIRDLYDAPESAGFWRFQSAVIASLLTLTADFEVQLPESTLSAYHPANDSDIGRLLAFWFDGIEQHVDLNALVWRVQERIDVDDVTRVHAFSNMPGAVRLRDVRATQRFATFDRTELESPRLRSALADLLRPADEY